MSDSARAALHPSEGVAPLTVLVVLMPFMFYVPFAGTLNMSLADAVIPIMFYRSMLLPRLAPKKVYVVDLWLYAVLLTVALSAAWNSLYPAAIEPTLLYTSMLKFLVGSMYAATAARYILLAIERNDWSWARAWTVVASCIGMGAIVTALTGLPLSRSFGPLENGRLTGSFEDPNLFAAYISVSIPLLLLWSRRRNNTMFWAQLVVLSLALLLTSSRGGIVAGLVAILGLLLAHAWSNRSPIQAVTAMVLAPLAYLSGTLIDSGLSASVGRLEDAGSLGLEVRMAFWRKALEGWETSPVLGIGPGQARLVTALPGEGQLGGVAHNTYVGILAELGILGVLTFIVPLFLATLRAFRSGPDKLTGQALAISGLGLAAAMLSLNLENARFTWFIAGVILIVATGQTRSRFTDRVQAHPAGETT